MRFSMKAARLHAGMSIEEAAEKLNIDVDLLRKYESCEEFPEVTLAVEMANVYGLESIDDMIFSNKPIQFERIKQEVKRAKSQQIN